MCRRQSKQSQTQHRRIDQVDWGRGNESKKLKFTIEIRWRNENSKQDMRQWWLFTIYLRMCQQIFVWHASVRAFQTGFTSCCELRTEINYILFNSLAFVHRQALYVWTFIELGSIKKCAKRSIWVFNMLGIWLFCVCAYYMHCIVCYIHRISSTNFHNWSLNVVFCSKVFDLRFFFVLLV